VQPKKVLRRIEQLRSGIDFIKDSKIDASTKIQIPVARRNESPTDQCLICGAVVVVTIVLDDDEDFYSFRRGNYGADSRKPSRGLDSVFYREKKYSINSS
jgi:hypothetical protein